MSDYISGAYEQIYKHSKWQTEARDYEDKLAATLYRAPFVIEASQKALVRISNILTGYYGTNAGKEGNGNLLNPEEMGAINDMASEVGSGDQNKVRINRTLIAGLMQARNSKTHADDNTGAGQIHRYEAGDVDLDSEFIASFLTAEEAEQKNAESLNEIINGNGNLREKMTLLYNGMFRNGGMKSDQIRNSVSYKGVLQGITQEKMDKSDSEAIKSINLPLLQQLSNYKSGKDVFENSKLAREIGAGAEALENKGNIFTRAWRGIKRWWSASVKSNRVKKWRSSSKERDKHKLGVEHYNKLGMELSDREKKFALSTGPDGKQELAWQEGVAHFQADKPVASQGMLRIAGPSGTTLRMLSAYKLMGANQRELLEFRLALIAWMCGSQDHSLHEILKGSHNAGIKGKEDLSEAANMYMSVDPLDKETLRNTVAKDGQFPHEIVYKTMLDELTDYRTENEDSQRKALGLEKKNSNTVMTVQIESLKKQKEILQKSIRTNQQVIKKIRSKQQGLLKRRPPKSLEPEELAKIPELEQLNERLKQDVDAFSETTANLQKYRDDNYADNPALQLYASGGKNSAITNARAKNQNAHNLALNIYTTGAYKSMNMGMKYGSMVSRHYLSDERVDEKKFGSYQSSYRAETKNKSVMNRIFMMVRMSARMAQEALLERSSRKGSTGEADYMHAAADIMTFRGMKKNGMDSDGADYTTGSLTSSSKLLEKAVMYFAKSAEVNGYEKSVVSVFRLHGGGAVDITKLSKVSGEAEVLIPKGSRFKVSQSMVRNVKISEIERAASSQAGRLSSDPAGLTREEIQTKGRDFRSLRHVNVAILDEIGKSSDFDEQQVDKSEETKLLEQRMEEMLKAKQELESLAKEAG